MSSRSVDPKRSDKPTKVSSQVEPVRSDQLALDGFQRVCEATRLDKLTSCSVVHRGTEPKKGAAHGEGSRLRNWPKSIAPAWRR